MKVFDKDGKVNFVDENNVLVGYDMGQGCCEYADWFVSDAKPTHLPGELPKPEDLEAWRFDSGEFSHVGLLSEEYEGCALGEGDAVMFRLVNGGDERFLVLFNCHNGYYSHGFTVSIGGKESEGEYL